MASETTVIDVERLPVAANVCEQELREVTKLPEASVAHVTMGSGAVSLLHEHHHMTEVYYVIRGEGILYHGDKALRVADDSYLVIPPHTPHKLRNTGNSPLEHLVIAAPPFDPADVHLLKDDRKVPTPYGPLPLPQAIQAPDGAMIHELMTEDERDTSDLSLAVGFLNPQQESHAHYNTKSHEAYYVIKGQGRIVVEDEPFTVKPGTVVVVSKGNVRHLENWGDDPMKVLCIANPAFREEHSRILR